MKNQLLLQAQLKIQVHLIKKSRFLIRVTNSDSLSFKNHGWQFLGEL